ncbi:protein of unknown function [Streptomyces murinus]
MDQAEERDVQRRDPQQREHDQQPEHRERLHLPLHAVRQPRLQHAVSVQARHRQQVQQRRRHLEQREERQREAEHHRHSVERVQPERRRAHHREQRVRQRARRRDQAQPSAAPDPAPLDEHRAARQTDPAHDHEQHRQHDAQQRVRVLQRVQREIALRADRDVAAVQGGARVRVLVQAQGDDPGGGHEQEHRDARPLRVSGPGGPAGHRRDGQDPDEHRADPPVAAGSSGGGGGHERLLCWAGGLIGRAGRAGWTDGRIGARGDPGRHAENVSHAPSGSWRVGECHGRVCSTRTGGGDAAGRRPRGTPGRKPGPAGPRPASGRALSRVRRGAASNCSLGP